MRNRFSSAATFRAVTRSIELLLVCLAVCAVGLGSPSAAEITTFDAPPGSMCIIVWSINPAGAITGIYADASYVHHGFLRARNGTIITFDLPPAAIGASYLSINPAGAVTGQYNDASDLYHGFLRAPDGTITTFDVPGASTTFALSINPAGAITGNYYDATGTHGFVRGR